MKDKNQKTKEALNWMVDQVLPDKEELFKLMNQRKIRIYLGIDPTGNKLHLGHAVPLRKLQEFIDLGHEVFLVVGTGTVLAGDPSLRDSARPQISDKEIKKNIKNWKKQASRVLDLSKVKIKYNGDWLLKLGLKDIIKIASHISAIKLFQRDMFKKRLQRGDTVWMSETIYPLLQGYDSVALDVDLEIGGTDQVFNMLIGRELQQKMKKREKFVMTLPMILGTDGKTMSKSSGNCIWIEDTAKDMFGKVMSIPDTLINSYFTILTNISLAEVKKMLPRDAKAKLAYKIVKSYHGSAAADKAAKEFNRIFREKKAPSNMPIVSLQQKEINLVDLLVKIKIASSKGEARRLIEQGGVKIAGYIEKDFKKKVKLKSGDIIQVGKRRFVKIS
ncbi:MAG: tyrosine--tRNA ligase [Candidatus Nealsonbacteria bacterium]